MSVATLADGRYRIERRLGSGGMAVVYCAHDEELSRTVAIKLLADHLADDDEFRARFLREARVAARLSHPNVVAVYDAGEDGGRPFIVMEVVEGETLAALLARRGHLRPDEVVALGTQAAAGLAHAHGHGLVHRDVKPHNLLIGKDGVLKVADFGIARAAAATQRLTQVGTILGTAAYLAPEQAIGEDVAATADVYSLGAVLYECLTGQTPFQADTLIQLVTAQQQAAIVPVAELVPDVPAVLEEAVMRCLARNPAYRPASAGEVARLLAGVSEAPTAPLPRPAPPARRSYARELKGLIALVAVAVAAGLVVLAISTTGGGSSRPAAPPPDRPSHPVQQAGDLADWLRAVAG